MSAKSKFAKWTSVLSLLFVAGLVAYYVRGRGKTHIAGIDFSHYSGWLLAIAGIFVFGLVLFVAVYRSIKTDSKKWVLRVAIIPLFIGCLYMSFAAFMLIRGWNFNSDAADIQIDTAASGDFQINSAQVEDYARKDSTTHKWTRIIRLDDRYRVVFEINCTNFTTPTANATQLYNDTTATLRGYNVQRNSVTGVYAPNVQPGDFTTSGAKTIVFDDVPQQADSPENLITYFNLTLLDSSGSLLASWIIHTDPSLSYWTLDDQV